MIQIALNLNFLSQKLTIIDFDFFWELKNYFKIV